jgi:hypothetical protein
MRAFYVIIILLLAVSFGAKSIIHVILDYRNRHKIALTSSKGYVYFLPYDKDVQESDGYLKRICNYLQKVSIFFLVVFIILFMARSIAKNE